MTTLHEEQTHASLTGQEKMSGPEDSSKEDEFSEEVENERICHMQEKQPNTNDMKFTELESLQVGLNYIMCVCAVSYTHLDVYKRQVCIILIHFHNYTASNRTLSSFPKLRGFTCVI